MSRLASLLIVLTTLATSDVAQSQFRTTDDPDTGGGGLLGGTIRNLGNATGIKVIEDLGKNLDAEHGRFKDNNDVYRRIEEGVSDGVKHLAREAFVESTWPLLASAISLSRDEAKRNGVSPIPEEIKSQIAGFVSFAVFSQVSYRIGGGGDLSLQVNSFRYGDAAAITLDDVIIFANPDFAKDAALWAHELKHAQQFLQWGLEDFSKRYIRDYNAVEQEARNSAQAYVAWSQARINLSSTSSTLQNPTGPNVLQNPPTFNPSQLQNPPTQVIASNICRPFVGGGCFMQMSVPLGLPCWCVTPWGPAQGAVGN